MDGIEQLICCSVEGEVKGYKAMPAHLINMSSDRNINQEAIRDMAQRKQVPILKIYIVQWTRFFFIIFKYFRIYN